MTDRCQRGATAAEHPFVKLCSLVSHVTYALHVAAAHEDYLYIPKLSSRQKYHFPLYGKLGPLLGAQFGWSPFEVGERESLAMGPSDTEGVLVNFKGGCSKDGQ